MKELNVMQMEEVSGGMSLACFSSGMAMAAADWGWFAGVAAMSGVGLVGAGIALFAAGVAVGATC